MGIALNLPDLPTDLFLIVTRYLDPIDTVRCRLVSKVWHREFTDSSFLRDILVREYGEAREVRALSELEVENRIDRPLTDSSSLLQNVWRSTFDRVLARKRALKSGRPRCVTKRELRTRPVNLIEEPASLQSRFIPVFPWGRYRRAAGQSGSVNSHMLLEEVPTDLLETEWTYDSGLLVYADMTDIQAYILLDIQQDTTSMVPFDMRDRIVRRIRLKHNLLVFEWAEEQPYHKLNELEDVHRHYVTVFDVQPARNSFPWLPQWNITFRHEWKMHYLGFPLSAQDTWFSDHSTTHYVVYIWQTNRSAWGENEPIESLLIWNISEPSSHCPSDDSSGGIQASVGPRLVKKLSYLDLEFLTVRQRDTPFLRKIALDGSACVYFFEEGCTRERGPHVGHGYETGRRNPQDIVWERIVAIPVQGPGPRWEDRLGRGSNFSGDWRHPDSTSSDPSTPKRATCWRYDGMGTGGIRNQVVRDEPASIKYSVVQRTVGFPEIWVSSNSYTWSTEIDLQDIDWQWKQIQGDESQLIIQSGEELHILRFDYDFGATQKRRKPFLSTAC